MASYIGALDLGTTSNRFVLFDHQGKIAGVDQMEHEQIFPKPGWVEHDPEAIWDSVRNVVRDSMQQAGATAGDVTAIGITNQRETTVVWDRETGQCIHNAIVWQDRRTAHTCDALKLEGNEALVVEKSGLKLDPYFSATKIAWILDHVDGARDKADRGQLAFGTVDSFLLWRLTGGRVHATDASNASRTMLFNIHTQDWDDELLGILEIPRAMLPKIDYMTYLDEFVLAATVLVSRQLLLAAEARIQPVEVVGPVAVITAKIDPGIPPLVGHRRRDPECGGAQILNIVEVVHQSLEVASGVFPRIGGIILIGALVVVHAGSYLSGSAHRGRFYLLILIFLALDTLGFHQSPYMGIVTFLALPTA